MIYQGQGWLILQECQEGCKERGDVGAVTALSAAMALCAVGRRAAWGLILSP